MRMTYMYTHGSHGSARDMLAHRPCTPARWDPVRIGAAGTS